MGEKLVIQGGRRLEGELAVQGSKNSALPILAAAVVTGGCSIIKNCPKLTDVDAASRILEYLGCKVARTGDTLIVDSSGICRSDIPEKLMHEMRSSIVFLGAILARFGSAVVSTPGGCEIGLRPINIHLSALEALGAEITELHGRLYCSCGDGLHGTKITLSFPSVGATENIMLAAVTAKGTTTIINAAREPEIVDLACFLNGCGAKIKGSGEGIITIEGVQSLNNYEHTVIPDRIVASTYMAAAAVTGGTIMLNNIIVEHLNPILSIYEKSGCSIRTSDESLEIKAPCRLGSIGAVRTMPYPGFPTDSQAAAMVMASIAQGTSVIIENIFENRYKHVGELVRMGAKIMVENIVAVVEGVPRLHGVEMEAADLRGGAALVLAGLAAEGETTVRGLHHVDRGCQSFENNLRSLGAEIKRC